MSWQFIVVPNFSITFLLELRIEMKKRTYLGGVFLCLTMGLHMTNAQTSGQPKIKMKQRLLLNQFESEYVLTASERMALKESRIAYQYKTKELLDSLDISTKKRKRLIQELKRNPLSDRVQDAISSEMKSNNNIED